MRRIVRTPVTPHPSRVSLEANQIDRNMKHLSHNMTVVSREMQNTEKQLNHLATDLHQETAELHNTNMLLEPLNHLRQEDHTVFYKRISPRYVLLDICLSLQRLQNASEQIN